MSHSDAGVLNVNFRTPATHKMAPWVRKTFIDFLPKFLFIERPPPAPPLEDQPNAELNAGFNIVFPETLEERHSVSRLLNHAQYDGGGFRSIYCRGHILSVGYLMFSEEMKSNNGEKELSCCQDNFNYEVLRY